jgi:hypothetical protein
MWARSVKRSTIALHNRALGIIVVHSENGKFNAVSIFMLGSHRGEPCFCYFDCRVRRIKDGVVREAINLSLARKRPDFSFGGVTASRDLSQIGIGGSIRWVTREVSYAAIPNARSMKRICPTTSPFANHLTCPFRMMFIAS